MSVPRDTSDEKPISEDEATRLLRDLGCGSIDEKRAAADALGEMRATWAVKPLIDALNDQHGWVRRRAAKALGAIGDPRAIEALTVALGDVDEEVRGRAAEALRVVQADAGGGEQAGGDEV